jgi:transcriptional antiterminator RfaH
MPTTPYESDIFPDNLLEFPPPDARWWAAYTFVCREKVFMQRLQKFKVPFYGPLIKRTTRTPSGRARPGFVPLFPGYVFLCGNEEQRLEAFRTKCVVRTVEAPDKAELIFDLRQVRQLIASDAPLSPEARLVRGMKVRIRSGPFAGIEGSVIKRRGKDTLLVAVNFLQQGASVVVGDYETERIE